MVKITINGRELQVERGTTILDAALKNHINIPHLCFLKDINEIGACRVCVVEIEGNSKLSPACNTIAEDGMVIYTNSPKVRQARRVNVELILSQHNARCPECPRSGNCALQEVANGLDVHRRPFREDLPDNDDWNMTFPLIRDSQKCIKCMRCIQVCDKIQGMHVWDTSKTGSRTTVGCSGGMKIDEAKCTICGQCITHCPVGALQERNDNSKVLNALADSDKIVIASVAPAVRSSWGEQLGLTHEEATMGRLAEALRTIGFNYVFDTDFAADLTIMEEGSEFVEKYKAAGGRPFTMFTSCCPGWIRFIKMEYPDLVPMLSSAKSPQQMFGAIIKTWYAQMLGVEPERIFHVSIMPCTAKKYEAGVSVMNASGARDVDVVLTVRELDRLIRSENVDLKALPDGELDMPLGLGTGAGVIFGTTGGVMEAALRSAHYLVTGRNPDPDAFRDVRGYKGWKEATFSIDGNEIKVAVAHGLNNVREICEAVRNGTAHYHFIEIMACPTGCAGGGGQPIRDGFELGEERGRMLLGMDRDAKLRFSHENPSVTQCYKEFLGTPGSEKAHHLLHTHQSEWELR